MQKINSGMETEQQIPEKSETKPVEEIQTQTADEKKQDEFFAIDIDDLKKQSEKPKSKVGRHPDDCNCAFHVKKRGFEVRDDGSNIPKPEHIGGFLRALNIVLKKVTDPLTSEEIKEGEEILFPIYRDIFPALGGEKSKYYEPALWGLDKLFASRTYDFSKIFKKKKVGEKTIDTKTGNRKTSEKPDWNKPK